MHHDLLIDPINTVFAVNCKEEGATLHCGAIYLEPLVHSSTITLAYNEAKIEVELPIELVNQSTPYRAWSIELPIKDV
jgi:hypothetical protein